MPLNSPLAHVNVSLRTTYNYAVTLKLQKEISEIRKKDFSLSWRKRVKKLQFKYCGTDVTISKNYLFLKISLL